MVGGFVLSLNYEIKKCSKYKLSMPDDFDIENYTKEVFFMFIRMQKRKYLRR